MRFKCFIGLHNLKYVASNYPSISNAYLYDGKIDIYKCKDCNKYDRLSPYLMDDCDRIYIK